MEKVIVSLLMSVVMCVTSWGVCPDDDLFETNESIDEAYDIGEDPFTLSEFALLDESAGSAVDYYRIPVVIGGMVDLTVTFEHSQGDIDIEIIDETEERLALSAGTSDIETINWISDVDGYVYLRVYLYQGAATDLCTAYTMDYSNSMMSCDDDNACTEDYYDSEIGCYHVPKICDDGSAGTLDTCDPVEGCVFTLIGCDDDVFEDNDTMETAWQVTNVPVSLEGFVSVYGDDDYFSLEVVAGDIVKVDCLFTHAMGDIDLYAIDSDGIEVSSSSGTSDNEHIEWISDVSGTFYIVVKMYSPDVCNEYVLDVSVCAGGVNELKVEEGDFLNGANYLISGTVSYPSLISWSLSITGGEYRQWFELIRGNEGFEDYLFGELVAGSYIPAGAYTLRLQSKVDCGGTPWESEDMVTLNLGYPGDLDHNNHVDLVDIAILANYWLCPRNEVEMGGYVETEQRNIFPMTGVQKVSEKPEKK